MKILYDISVLGSGYYNQRVRTGIFRVIENLAKYLKNTEECELSFCAYNSFEQLIQSINYMKSNAELNDVTLYYHGGSFINRITEELYRLYPVPGTKLSSIFLRKFFSLFLMRFNFVFNSLDPTMLKDADIFHATFYPLPENIKEFNNIKRFITIYDLIPILYPQFFEFKEDHLLKKIIKSIKSDDWILCISNATKNDFCNYCKIDPSRVFITHLAASDLFYQCTEPAQMTSVHSRYHIPDAPYVLSLSTLEPRKNIDHVIRCFARIVQEHNIKDLNLVLVGTKGWDFSKIFKEISNFSTINDRIIVTGYVADEDLAALYSGAMVFVYPSFYEGFGLPPLEAMQCGVPVITSNTSSLPEVVGDAGIMVAPTDTDALCQAMYDLYRRPSLRDDLSKKSLERASRFSWAACARDTVRAYQTALGRTA